MQTRVRIEFECALDHPSSHLASAGQDSFAAARRREGIPRDDKAERVLAMLGEACEKCGSEQTRPARRPGKTGG
jgi:hypothetical protein